MHLLDYSALNFEEENRKQLQTLISSQLPLVLYNVPLKLNDKM